MSDEQLILLKDVIKMAPRLNFNCLNSIKILMEEAIKIIIRPKALKFIENKIISQRLRIYKAIYSLPNGDIKKLVGCKELFRLRVGNFRILYEIDQNNLIIIVTNIANRGQIYKSLFL